MNKLDKFFNSEDKWTKLILSTDKGEYCLLGGIYKVYKKQKNRDEQVYLIADKIVKSRMYKAPKTIDKIEIYKEHPTAYNASILITSFNDQTRTTFKQIKNLLRSL